MGYVEENTGMAGVVPAWKIADILNSEKLVAMRRSQDEMLAKQERESTIGLDYPSRPKEGSTFSKDDFQNALKKASKRIQPSQSDKEK